MIRNERAARIKAALSDPEYVADRLGLEIGWRSRATGSVKVCCPVHNDKDPSLSLRRGPRDGTLAAKCHTAGCAFRGDVYHLLGAIHHLDPRVDDDFKKLLDIGDALIGGGSTHVEPRRAIERAPTPEYPTAGALRSVLSRCRPCASDNEVTAWLASRGLDAAAVDAHELASAILPNQSGLPDWGRNWSRVHRLILPVYDADGVARSVRGRAVRANARRKTMSVTLCPTRGLVVADAGGIAALRGDDAAPSIVAIVEGEPDFLTLATAGLDVGVLGIVAPDCWTPELGRRLWGREVILAVDDDQAGDHYVRQILRTIAGRCVVRDVFSSGRAARASGLDWPSSWDLNELHADGADLLAMIRDAPIVMTPETAPSLAPEPTQDAPDEPEAVDVDKPPPKAVQRAIERAIARLDGIEFKWLRPERLAVIQAILRHTWWRHVPGELGELQTLGVSFAAVPTLAQEANVTEKTVGRAVAWLVERGDLEVFHRESAGGRWKETSKLYRLKGPLLQAGLGE